MAVPLLTAERHWECLSCDLTGVSQGPTPNNKMHPCAGLAGLSIPMVPAGTRGENTVRVREDYLASAVTPIVDGRPVMSVQTRYDDGREACTIYVPPATTIKD